MQKCLLVMLTSAIQLLHFLPFIAVIFF
uniref:Uncharacterized protein n=1 Tax=Arundo donax TaxID=35708 RepID=A0A0A9HV30_ARUDO